MAEQLRVFVSSVMTSGYLAEERERTRDAIRSLRLTVPWDFAEAPAESASPIEVALREVERSDIFVLLVSNMHTEPVAAELNEAERTGKPILVFVEKLSRANESSDRRELLNQLAHHKYGEFDGLDELEREVREAIIRELVEGYRRYQSRLSREDIRTLVGSGPEQVASPPSLAVRPAAEEDREAIRETLMDLAQWYPSIDGWIERIGLDQHVRVVDVGGTIAAIAVARDKDGDVRKLATLYVRPTGQGEAVGPHLVREEIRRAKDDGIRKAYVTCADEIAERLKPILEQNGFVVEGASPGRYRAGSAEWVLGKTFVYGEIARDDFPAFVKTRLITEVGGVIEEDGGAVFTARLPRFPISGGLDGEPTRFVISTGPEPESEYAQYQEQFSDHHWRFVSMFGRPADTSHPFHGAANWIDGADLSARFYPAELDTRGQDSLVVTIRPAYANALIPYSRAPSLLPPTRLQLRPDNVYYRTPNQYQALRRGSRLLFYVSEPEQAVRGWGTITSVHVGTPEDCFARYGTRGVFDYGDLERIANNNDGNVLAIAFDWYDEFNNRVRLHEVQRIVSGYNPVTARSIQSDEARQIIDRGSRGDN